MNCLLFFGCIFASLVIGECYLPVICFTGFLDPYPDIEVITCPEIQKLHPGTYCKKIQVPTFNVLGLWAQMDLYKLQVQLEFAKYPNGVHFIGASLGGIVARTLIETMPNHPVKNFISLAGPHMGIFGLPFSNITILNENLNNLTQSQLTNLFYTDLFQTGFSVANVWNDPMRQSDFLTKNTFLPLINNMIPHAKDAAYKQAFLRLNNTIWIAGDKDTEIIPWQSSRGDYYYPTLNIVPLDQLPIYTNDTFGLRTLDQRGGLHIKTIAGADHNYFSANADSVNDYIEWLT